MGQSRWVFKSMVMRIAIVLTCLGLVVGAILFYGRLLKPRPLTPLDRLLVTGADPDKRIPDGRTYRLRIWGKVGKETSLTLEQVMALPAHETDVPLDCVTGRTDRALWRGARIADVIALAQPDPDATFLVFRDDRDFSSSLSMDDVRSGRPLLAWSADGQELPRVQGWPLRVVAPGKWGYKWVKWVTSIELTNRGYEGTYEGHGYSLDGDRNKPETEADKQNGHQR